MIDRRDSDRLGAGPIVLLFLAVIARDGARADYSAQTRRQPALGDLPGSDAEKQEATSPEQPVGAGRVIRCQAPLVSVSAPDVVRGLDPHSPSSGEPNPWVQPRKRVRGSTGELRWPGLDQQRAAVICTLTGTAKLNGINPQHYLRYVLERMAEHKINRIDELLPWAVAARLAPDAPDTNQAQDWPLAA